MSLTAEGVASLTNELRRFLREQSRETGCRGCPQCSTIARRSARRLLNATRWDVAVAVAASDTHVAWAALERDDADVLIVKALAFQRLVEDEFSWN